MVESENHHDDENQRNHLVNDSAFIVRIVEPPVQYEPVQTPPESPLKLKKGQLIPESHVPYPGWWTSTRFRISLLIMSGIAINSSMRFNLSVAMVCMVNSTAFSPTSMHTNNSNATLGNQSTPDTGGACSEEYLQSIAGDYDGSFDWDSERQGLIFSAIWWGGVLTTFPGGFVADRYGPKNTAAFCGLIFIATSAMIPSMARFGYQYVLLMRFLMGLGQGIMVPTMSSLISRWYPPGERTIALATMTAGNQIAVIFGNPLFAWLCTQKELFGGWPMIFYLSSFLALSWLTVFVLYVSNRPAKHRSIGQRELLYIEYELRNEHMSGKRKSTKVPWAAMAKSRTIWAIMLSNFSAAFVNFTLATYIPTYFKEVLYFDIRKNGLLSSLPFITQFFSKYIWAFMSRQLLKRTSISQTTACTIFNSIGAFGQSLFLIVVSFLDCSNSTVAVFCLCASNFMCGSLISGFITASFFVAPKFSGSVVSCGATMSQIGGILSPYLVGSITKNGTRLEWQTVFIITTAVLCSVNIFWIFFGSAKIQPWAMTQEEEEEDDLKPIKKGPNSTNGDHHIIQDAHSLSSQNLMPDKDGFAQIEKY